MIKKSILLVILSVCFSLISFAQTLTVTQSLQEMPNATVLNTYPTQFGSWLKPDLDDTFPYAVIRLGLEGTDSEIVKAKQMLNLNLGNQTPIVNVDRSAENELLFLIPKRTRSIVVTCGDGCERQSILDPNMRLESNHIYYARVHYVPSEDFDMLSMAQSRQLFQLYVSPHDALVQVDVDGRRELWPAMDGVASKMLNVGTYTYKVSSARYYPEEGSFTVSPHSKELQVQLRPRFGWLTIDGSTDIYGAYVFATDERTGSTTQLGTIPINRAELNPGSYTLIIQQNKYKDYSTSVAVYEAENTSIRPELEPNFAQVSLTTLEYADIYINGRKMGKGTWDGTLEYGDYAVETRMHNYQSAFTYFTISPTDGNVALPLNNPTPMYGTLIIDGSPIDAQLTVDEKQMGTTPLVINQILIGEHRVRINKDGFANFEQVVNVLENQDQVVTYTLAAGEGSTMNSNLQVPDNIEYEQFMVYDVPFKMVKVKGGTFIMGATAEQREDMSDNEIPIHQVTLSDYYIGQTEVTQALWQAVMGNNPSAFPSNSSNPIEMVSWEDCQTFISKLNKITGQQFRMPTEAEWEYAARGGNDTVSYTYAGDSILANVGWYNNNGVGSTHIVASKKPNQLGLYDMSGNVCEWCQDWYGMYTVNTQTNPTGPEEGTHRVYRGGSYYLDARYCRVSQRNYHTSTFSNFNIGLRLAMTNVLERKEIKKVETKTVSLLNQVDSANIFEVNGVSFAMVDVEGGDFLMGATDEQVSDALGGEYPVRQISLSDFAISQTEVTQELWKAVMGNNPSPDTTSLKRPVVNVSWDECQTFVRKLSHLTGENFRLPTEAQWEYAARGGKKTKQYKYAGAALADNVAWHFANSTNRVQLIAKKAPNELGLYDMSGNVREWCQDWFATYDGDMLLNPKGPTTGSYRVIRGGSVANHMRNVRISHRDGLAPKERHADLGLRIVKVKEEEVLATPVQPYIIPKHETTLRFDVKGVSFTMVKVASGSFIMGATPEHRDVANDWEKPMHYVTLPEYFIGQTEVTQELWKAVMDSVPATFQNDPTNPVEGVSWNDCQTFIKRLNALTGANFRLPTEAEWEYAARGGTEEKKDMYSGGSEVNDVAWYKENSIGSTHPVGLKKPNKLGLYDMSGNVWEWCQDWYGEYDAASQINPKGPEDSNTKRKVVRGGSWAYDSNLCRTSTRTGQHIDSKMGDIGLRLVL